MEKTLLRSVTFDFKNPHFPTITKYFYDEDEANAYFEKKKKEIMEYDNGEILIDAYSVFETEFRKISKAEIHLPLPF